MGSAVEYKRGVDKDRLTDNQQRFVEEYCLDFNATRAAKAAGYSAKGASVTGTKMLAHPLVRRAIGKQLADARELYKAQLLMIVKQVALCGLRDGGDAFDHKTGKLLPVHKMPESIRMSINGVDQKVRTYTDADGNMTEEVETKLTLVPKQQAWDMALKITGDYEVDEDKKPTGEVGKDWDELYEREPQASNVVDVTATVVSTTPLIEDRRAKA